MQTDMPRPGPEHAKLARFAGTWRGEEIMHPSAWAPEGKRTTGLLESRLDLGGFFLLTDYEQRTGDEVTFRAHGVYGVHSTTGRTTFYWFDTMGGDFGAPATGTWDGDVLTFESQNPYGHGRFVYAFQDDDTYTFEMAFSPDGKDWQRLMEATYRKVS